MHGSMNIKLVNIVFPYMMFVLCMLLFRVLVSV
jgi:hypothetical protein